MIINVERRYRLHRFIFALLSLQLFVFSSVSFLSEFLAGLICAGVFIHIKKIKFR